MVEKFTGTDGSIRWTHYLVSAGGLVGMHVENSDETVLTRYFHKDHLGSIAVITSEAGAVLERLSFDAWGKRRYSDGADDPAGSIASQTSRGFTGHEELDAVGLVHMNGRVYDPLLARFGTPDPTTESPFSTQGWNRYSYVGNSPLNFTDPSGYCFLGCFWKPVFKAVGNFLKQAWGSILQIAAVAICAPYGLAPVCAGVAAAFVTGVTSGNLGLAIKAGFIAGVMVGISQYAQQFAPAATSGSPADWGPPMKLGGDVAEGSITEGVGERVIELQWAPPNAPIPAAVSAGAPSASSYLGQNLLQGTISTIPGAFYSQLALQQYRTGNYGPAVAYTIVSVADSAMAMATFGVSARLTTATRAILEASTTTAIARHHAWPKYLGGEIAQDLVPLPKSLHDAYHSGLDKILPRQWGTAYYENLAPAARDQVLRDLGDYTKAFDAKYGTRLYDAMLHNGFPLP